MKEQRMARSLVGKGSLATKLVLTLVAACMAISLGWLVGCSSGEKQQEGSGQSTEDISVYSREDGSGTRGAFIELFGLEEKTIRVTRSTPRPMQLLSPTPLRS